MGRTSRPQLRVSRAETQLETVCTELAAAAAAEDAASAAARIVEDEEALRVARAETQLDEREKKRKTRLKIISFYAHMVELK
jgi:hypothetical protein